MASSSNFSFLQEHDPIFLQLASTAEQAAREAALSLDIKAVLIDGSELAQLMVENNLGCSVKQVYEVKQLDSDYFNED